MEVTLAQVFQQDPPFETEFTVSTVRPFSIASKYQETGQNSSFFREFFNKPDTTSQEPTETTVEHITAALEVL